MIGERLSHFRIDAKLGAGGMGEVYRAWDAKLEREVAVKVLPSGLASDPERLARFEREAKLLASLNHPNIASVYAFETAKRSGTETSPHKDAERSAETVHFLVMELVAGESLAERLRRGAMPLDAGLPIALQIAHALEAAHEHHVIHRDLKPGNVMVTAEGQVKVLDFGLAKALMAGTEAGRSGDEGSDPGEAPTLTAEMTRAGMVLGTATYMSPEQVRAGTLDKRTDIWSFGVVMFEMLTGRRLFEGESISDTMAEVLKGEPDLSELPPHLPRPLRSVVARCLEKDPRRRLRDIGEARIALEDAVAGGRDSESSVVVPAPSPKATLLPWLLAAAFAALAIVAFLQGGSRSPDSTPEVVRTSILLPPETPLSLTQTTSVAVAPDGKTIAFIGGKGAGRKLFVRHLDADEAVAIEGTEGAESPVFSPTGQWIGFVSGTRLRKVAATGGPTQEVSFMAPVSRGLEWWREDSIVATPTKSSGLITISPATGEFATLTKPEEGEVSGHCWPHALPDGHGMLVTSLPVESNSWNEARILLVDPESGTSRVVIEGGSQARYLETGHVVFAREGQLFAAPFDLSSGAVTGPAVVVVDDLLTNPTSGAGQFAIAESGTLVYARGGNQPVETRRLLWIDRSGRREPLTSEPSSLYYPRISPDGRRVVMTIEGAADDVWLLDLQRSVLRRVTFGARHLLPTWGPSAGEITYSAARGSFPAVYIQELGSGEERHLAGGDVGLFTGSWSPDGTMLAAGFGDGSNWNIVLIEDQGQMQTFLDSPFTESAPSISPDGRWLAYVSDESGRAEVFVTSFPQADRRVQVSVDGGTQPVWSSSGKSLFFIAPGGIHEVEVTAGTDLEAGSPDLVVAGEFATGGSVPFVAQFDVDIDGSRFLVLEEEPVPEIGRLEVVFNWFEDLERRLLTIRE